MSSLARAATIFLASAVASAVSAPQMRAAIFVTRPDSSCGIAIKDQDNVDSGVAPDDELLGLIEAMRNAADPSDLKEAYGKAFGRVRTIADDGKLMKQIVDLNEEIKAEFKRRSK